MKPNKKTQVSQPVDSNPEQPKVIQDNQYGAKQKNTASPNSEKVPSPASKEEMETGAVEKDRSKKANVSAPKINTTKGNR